MVSYKEIKASNENIDDITAPRVAVFAGGTSGIGKLTIKALVSAGASLKIYLVGRKNSSERMQEYIKGLTAINSKAEIIWTEGEISLLAETKRVCEGIKQKESHVDLLFLTAGYAPFGGRNETPEGVEITQSLGYYSRILFIQHLLPLLKKAEGAPRVISVLAGGLERANSIDVDDLDLKKPGNFSAMKAQAQYGAMNTVTMDKLATDNPHVTFIHSWPGWLDTGNVKRGQDPNSNSVMAWVVKLLIEPVIYLFSLNHEESAQRYLFECTSAAFGGRGVAWKGKPGTNSQGKQVDGLFLVNYKCDCTPNAKVLPILREKAQGKVWDHTQEVLRPYL
jgi:NAD(P)-dependent dehydrogenase (short-subunit alcohol dehydrogenase family)